MATLTGAYVVNGLSQEESAEFEQHLAACADCAQEVRELRETVAKLGAAAATAPPEELKQRVLDEVARTRQQPPRVDEPSTDGPTAESRPTDGASTTNVRALRPRMRQWGMRLAVAAAVVGVALATAFGGFAWHAQQQVADLTERMERADTGGVEMAQLLQASDANIVQGSTGESSATSVVSREDGRAMFLSSDMPKPPPDRAYQLWFMDDEGATSAGMYTPGGGDEVDSVTASMPADASQMAVTVEPASGSEQPTTDPIMVMDMPA